MPSFARPKGELHCDLHALFMPSHDFDTAHGTVAQAWTQRYECVVAWLDSLEAIYAAFGRCGTRFGAGDLVA
jgi:hypothetical protein